MSLGIGRLVADLQNAGETPYALLDRFRKHPSVAPLIEGSEGKEYSAHLIPERGYEAIPRIHGEGWASKAMQNFVRVEGAPNANEEKTTLRSFVEARSWSGLFGNAFRLARVAIIAHLNQAGHGIWRPKPQCASKTS